MKCRKVQLLIQAYVDGSASGAERQAVDAHLRRCGDCSRALEESRQLVALLGAAPARRTPDGFEAGLRAALREVQPAPPAAAWWERFRVRHEWQVRVPALAMAGSLAVALVTAVVTPQVAQRTAQAAARRQYLTSAVERHRQLENAEVDWEAVESSIELNTGRLIDD